MAVRPSPPLPGSLFYLKRQRSCPQCTWGMEEKTAAQSGASGASRELPGPRRISAVQYFNTAVDQNHILPGALRLIQELRPHWKPEQVKTKRFTDGITNKLVACFVEDDMRDAVLVRVYGERTELLVDRENEVRNFQLLRAHGCAPKLYCTFQNGLCYEFLPGMALGPEHILEPRLFRPLELYALADFLANRAGSGIWRRGEENEADCLGNGKNPRHPCQRLSAQTWPVVQNVQIFHSCQGFFQLQVKKGAVVRNPCPTLPRLGHVRFIDYEYAGYNYQAFDIGNHFNEFAGVNEVDYSLYPSRETQLRWLNYYLQAHKQLCKEGWGGTAVTPREVEKLYVQVNKFALASHLLWAFWALIQNQFSTIDFDFLRYAVIRFNQYFKVKPQVSALEMPK
ncbi:ethanolamine kinase 2 [Vombatus ursinus]|uniref:ethanolamine kinase 2 n=1 Tax=Vombatus ursinus TaxID=29139 RepID=UPI000FFD257A|nr:ethanolamine kinase 2 [Vombatus ursinus]